MKEKILSHLPQGHPWGDSILWFEAVDSTNTRAKALATAGAPQGTVIIADSQSAGRGRLGRSFCSPAGSGIYMSVILRPGCKPDRLMHLTCAVAVAVCRAVEDTTGFRPGIKWINDLVAGNRKLGGILTELSIQPSTGLVDHAIVGIGINCTGQPEDFPEDIRSIACSAAMVTGKAPDRGALAAAMICELEQMSRQLLSERSAILAQYRKDCLTIGKEIQVLTVENRRSATALDIDENGSLLVRYADGTTGTVNSGEVSVRGLYAYL